MTRKETPMTVNRQTVDVLGGGRAGQRGLDTAKSCLRRSARLGKLAAEQADAALANLAGTSDLADVAPADLLIEAVFADLELKNGPVRGTRQRRVSGRASAH